MTASQYDHDVFVNCPFDSEYRALFDAIVFTIHDCGYVARSALEVRDASQVRIEKITAIISECRFGLHDISRTEPDAANGLPRFNMPLELGLFLGAKRFGDAVQRLKNCLVLDTERYRYQKSCRSRNGSKRAVLAPSNSRHNPTSTNPASRHRICASSALHCTPP